MLPVTVAGTVSCSRQSGLCCGPCDAASSAVHSTLPTWPISLRARLPTAISTSMSSRFCPPVHHGSDKDAAVLGWPLMFDESIGQAACGGYDLVDLLVGIETPFELQA